MLQKQTGAVESARVLGRGRRGVVHPSSFWGCWRSAGTARCCTSAYPFHPNQARRPPFDPIYPFFALPDRLSQASRRRPTTRPCRSALLEARNTHIIARSRPAMTVHRGCSRTTHDMGAHMLPSHHLGRCRAGRASCACASCACAMRLR